MHRFWNVKIFEAMPKKYFEKVQLPNKKPNCCAECPLCGIIPKIEVPKFSKETHVCLGTRHAMSGRGIVSVSKRHARPCDKMWRIWEKLPAHTLAVPIDFYLQYRLPFELKQTRYNIIFH